MSYRSPVSQEPRTPTEFGRYLLAAMKRAGFSNLSQFSRAAGLGSSVTHRWVFGGADPSLPALAQASRKLGVSLGELVAQAYPDDFGDLAAGSGNPVVAELALMLDPTSPLSPEDRELIEVMIARFLEPYRRKLRKLRTE